MWLRLHCCKVRNYFCYFILFTFFTIFSTTTNDFLIVSLTLIKDKITYHGLPQVRILKVRLVHMPHPNGIYWVVLLLREQIFFVYFFQNNHPFSIIKFQISTCQNQALVSSQNSHPVDQVQIPSPSLNSPSLSPNFTH